MANDDNNVQGASTKPKTRAERAAASDARIEALEAGIRNELNSENARSNGAGPMQVETSQVTQAPISRSPSSASVSGEAMDGVEAAVQSNKRTHAEMQGNQAGGETQRNVMPRPNDIEIDVTSQSGAARQPDPVSSSTVSSSVRPEAAPAVRNNDNAGVTIADVTGQADPLSAAQKAATSRTEPKTTNDLPDAAGRTEPKKVYEGVMTENASQKMAHNAADKYLDVVAKGGRMPVGSSGAALDARTEMLKIAGENYKTMQTGSFAEKNAIVKQLNAQSQSVQYADGRTPKKFDIGSAQQLGKATDTFARARADSLVPLNGTAQTEKTLIPPQIQRNVAMHMSGPGGFERASAERIVDHSATPITSKNGKEIHASGSVRNSDLMAGIERTQALIQKELAPYTSPGADGARQMSAAVGEIAKNREAIVADRGLQNAALYNGVNTKIDPSVTREARPEFGPQTKEQAFATRDIPAFKAPVGVAEASARTAHSVSTPSSAQTAKANVIEIKAVPERGASAADAAANATRRAVPQVREAAAAAKAAPSASKEAPARMDRSRERSAGGRA
jgi:hypothetical protein